MGLQNGLYSALPFALLVASKLVLGTLAHRLRKSPRLSHSTVSKLFNTLGARASRAASLGR